MALNKADARAVLDAAVALAAHPAPDFAAVLDVLRLVIPCDNASFNDMAMATRDYRYALVPPSDIAMAVRLKPTYDKYAHQHPLINAAFANSSLGAIRFCDVAGDFTSTELYQYFYAPFNIRYQLVVALPSPPDVVVGYALNRSEAAGEFSDRDVEVLNTLSGHLAMHHRASMDGDRTRLLSTELDRYAWAVVSVRSDGVVEASSSIELESGLRVPDAVAALLDANGSPTGGESRHDVELGDERWHCIVQPVPLGPTVLLMRRVQDVSGDSAALVAAGLTPRQADVLMALARTGGSNGELSAELGMSEGTVKKHLEAVFRTLGVTSRAGAVLALRDLTR